MERINILMAADDKYVQHLGVTLISVLENTKKPQSFYITVLDGGISVLQKILLENVIKKYGATLVFKEIKLQNPEKYKVNGHISIAAYFRILLPEVFHPFTEKIIYLDCDVIVTTDLHNLYNINIDDYVIGAVAETSNSRMEDFGYPDKLYFNSGVLLINFKNWVAEDVTRKVLDFIFKYPEKLIYWDQDALNACLVDRWLPLDKKWNYLREFVELNKNWKDPKYNLPYIVHFSNNTKPWIYYSRNPYDYLYFKYLAKSPWKNFKPAGKTFTRVISKVVKLTLRKANMLHGM